jgi:hypothetical protein
VSIYYTTFLYENKNQQLIDSSTVAFCHAILIAKQMLKLYQSKLIFLKILFNNNSICNLQKKSMGCCFKEENEVTW